VAHEREGSEAKSSFRENPVSEFSALDHFGVVPSHDGLVFAAVSDGRIRPTGSSAVVRASGRRSCFGRMKKLRLKGGQSGSFYDHPDNSQDDRIP
jgi:hypothetical protein